MSTQLKLILSLLFLMQLGVFAWSYYEDEQEKAIFREHFMRYLDNPLAVDSIDLSGLELDMLLEELSECQNVTYINLSDNNFTEIPAILYKFPRLKTLILSRNKLSEKITIEKKLPITYLDLSKNNIEFLLNTDKLELIEVADLSHNRFKTTQDFSTTPLDTLLVSHNSIRTISAFMRKLPPYLQHLDLSNNKLSKNEAIELLKRRCASLDLSNNHFVFEEEINNGTNTYIQEKPAYFPSDFATTTSNIRHLKMNNCNIGHLNVDFKSNMESLDIGGNEFDLTCKLDSFQMLRNLDISYMAMEYFSYACDSLRTLNMRDIIIRQDLSLDFPNLETLHFSNYNLIMDNILTVDLTNVKNVYYYINNEHNTLKKSHLQVFFPKAKIQMIDNY